MTSIEKCNEGLLSISKDVFDTLCPNDYEEWYPLLIICIIATAFFVLSIFSILILNHVIDPVKKMRLAKTFCCGFLIWPENDMALLPFINQIKDKATFEQADTEIEKLSGETMLERSVKSRLHGFSKVLSNTFLQHN